MFEASAILVLNLCEKAWMANGWVISTWTKPGELRYVHRCLLGDLVLSMCSGSGSMMQACMETGRSCVAIEINGLLVVLV